MLAHIACLWQVNDIYCFLWSLFAKGNRSWWAAFHQWNNLVNSYGLLVCKRLNILSVSASRRSPKTRMQLSLIYFRFADFRMIRISELPVANLYLTLKRRLNGRFSEVRALKSQFSDAKWNLGLVDILILGQTFTSWKLFSRAIQHETWPSFICFGLRIVSMDSNMTAYQQFLKNIYWNFMESGISGIRIWLDLWVSANNELGKPYFWQNLLETNS